MFMTPLEQVTVDDGDSPYDLADCLGTYSGNGRSHAQVVIKNTGTVTAYVGHEDDTPPTAQEIPPGETRTLGPFGWPGGEPTLFMASGAECLISPWVSR